ncbi:MAG: SDR family oxidoreductase [Planctomycetes bacterium]|nr:SDR family oxidoreductase [Planctomycetota bacterium]
MVTGNRSISNSEGLFGLSGKVAIVTGAAGQLGGEYVQTLLAANASVGALDINLDNPKSKLDKIDSDNLLMVEADITNRESLENGLGKVVSRFGAPRILVNNAALDAPPDTSEHETGSFETYPESSWNAIMDVNLTGMFLSCQVIGGAIAKSGKGSIINISSIYGNLSPDQRLYEYKEEPFFKPVAYSVTKSGVLNLTRYLATYWAKKGVRVNTLTLGGVFNNQDDTFLKNYCSKVPLGRMAGEGEYSGAILFLASDASSYMTGANLIIDGGYSCW